MPARPRGVAPLSMAIVGVLAAAVVTLATGAADAGHAAPVPTAGPATPASPAGTPAVPSPGDGPLAAAVDRLNATRAVALKDAQALTHAASVLDAADAGAATGDPDAVKVQSQVPTQEKAYQATLQHAPADAAAYADALQALHTAAATRLSGDAKRAVDRVVQVGQAERDALSAFEAAAKDAWPAYKILADQEQVWHYRAANGWFRSQKESADAYAVMLAAARQPLDAGRRQLAATAGTLQATSGQMSGALRRAQDALQPH